MILWTPPAAPLRRAPGRHRRPALHVDESRLPDDYLADVARHLADGRGIDESTTLAGLDADDRILAWAVAR